MKKIAALPLVLLLTSVSGCAPAPPGGAGRAEIRPGPTIQMKQVQRAVRRLSRRVDIPIRLPQPLVRGVHLAEKTPIKYRRNGVTLHIEWGRKRHLFLSYGAASWDGCGGTELARRVQVGPTRGFLYDSPNARWSHVIWPMRANETHGIYGLAGSVSPRRMVQLAASMTPSRVPRPDPVDISGC